MTQDTETGTHRTATREEIKEWDEENDEPHPVFEVPHRPERKPVITTATPRLKFADKHKERILKGQKTVTLRLNLEYEEFTIGSAFDLCDEDGERFASAIVNDRGYTTVDMAAKMDFDGHRNYRDTDELLDELRGYYPDEEIHDQTYLEIVYWDWEELWE